MKNLIIALSLFLAVGASAQSKTTKKSVATKETINPQVSIEKAAQKNYDDLMAFITVSPETQTALKDLFITKYELLQQTIGLPAERRNTVKEGIENRLSLLLDPATFERVKANKTLYNSLIN